MDTETLLGIDAKLTLALLSSATALLVAVVGWWLNRGTSKALARLESELRQKETRADAKLAYEFEARKKLYHECEPLLFQLSDAAERAESRIYGFAREASRGKLEPDGKDNWLTSDRYYYFSSCYRLFLPLGSAQLLRRRLTHLDLGLDRKT